MKEQNHIFPFLWVHGESEETYRKMIGVIYDANIREFCVEARPHKGFGEEPWWHDMDIILDEAQRRGMRVWILDDKHFPTGYANGKVLDAPTVQRRQGLFLKTFPVKNEKVVLNLSRHCHPPGFRLNSKTAQMYLLTDIFNKNKAAGCRFTDDQAYSVTAIRTDRPGGVPVSLEEYVQDGILRWNAPEGQWQVQMCCLSRNIGTHRSYINMMDKESCRIQLEAVYEPHYAHYGDKFGTVIAGFFSDEPELGNNYMYRMYNTLGTDQDLPWSRELESALGTRLGKDFGCLLPLLWNNDCDSALTAKVRYTFMDCVSRLVEKDFSRQIGDWCRERGVEYIGHVVEDNNQHARTGTSLGHYFRGLKWQTMAGIDDIGGQVYHGKEDRKEKNFFGYYDDGEFYHYALGKLGSSLGALNPHMQGRAMCEIFGNYGWSEGVRLEKYLVDHFMVRGINYFVPHAFTCSAYPEKDCPPHFYAQGNNPQYRHFGALMRYVERVCRMISGGSPDVSVGVLYHAEAEWSGKCMLMQKPARVLLDNQIDFFFVPADVFTERAFYRTEITDRLTVNGHSFRMLVIPYAQYITKDTAEAVQEMIQNGGEVVFLEGLPEGLCTGEAFPDTLKDCRVLSLSGLIDEVDRIGLRTVLLSPADDRVRVMHYLGDRELYYLFNEGAKTYSGFATLPADIPLYAYNAWDDQTEVLTAQKGRIQINLSPGHSLLIMAGEAKQLNMPPMLQGQKLLLTDFIQSVCRSKEYPNFGNSREINKLESYALTDKRFSGVIRYETKFNAEAGQCAVLEITDAYEGVEVFLNGWTAGIQVMPPFRYDLSRLVAEGENHLVIEVATTLERERGKTKKAAPTGITGEVAVYLQSAD